MNQNTLGKNLSADPIYAYGAQARETPQLQSQINLLHDASVRANSMCEKLAERLAQLLREYSETGQSVKAEPEEALVNYAEQIRGERKSIEAVCIKMQSIISRLEA
jgi:hypothetical protein